MLKIASNRRVKFGSTKNDSYLCSALGNALQSNHKTGCQLQVFFLYSQSTTEGDVDGLRLEDARIGRDVVRQPDVTTDGGMVANGNAAQDGSVGIAGDMVLDDGVARHVEDVASFVVLEALGAKGDTLIEGDMVADDAGLTDDDACTVVDGEIFANLGSRMNVDAGLGVCQLGDDSWNDGHSQLMELMGNTIVCHGVHDGIAEDDFAIVGCSRVAVEHGLYVGIEQTLDFGQRVDEFEGEPSSLLVDLLFGFDGVAVFAELQSVSNLLDEQPLQLFKMNANVVRTDGLVGLSFVEIVGEADGLC